MTIALTSTATNGNLRLDFSISAELTVSAEEAKRTVVAYCMDALSLFVSPQQPTLVVQDERSIYWRFPLELAMGKRGKLGELGTIDVDALSGELCVTERLTEEFRTYASRLASSPAHSPVA